MHRYNYIFLFLVLGCSVITGCDRYLDIQPKGKTLLSTVTDYDQWMNAPSLAFGFGAPFGYTNYMADNVDFVNVSTPPTTTSELLFTWSLQFTPDVASAPLLWGEHYANINHYNTVLLGIDKATNGTESQKRTLKAEALLSRALEYFYLVNEYGRPYDSATAGEDLAVPFVTSNDVTQTVPERSTVAAIYTHILDDVNDAIPDLPLYNAMNRLRGSRAAAYSLLARIYFYAGNYMEAARHAQLALDNTQAVMMDFNAPPPTSNLVSIRQDVIYARFVIGNFPVALDFMRTFAGDDLRVSRLYRSLDNNQYVTRGATMFIPQVVTASFEYVNTGTSVQEMKLIIAENAARSGDLPVALHELDEVRKNRIAASGYIPFSSADKDSVLAEVLLERYHELAFTGLRWFDMRRLDKENRMGTVTRYDANGNVIATLPPHSDRYTLQIPTQVLSFNPGMPQNP